MYTAPMLSATYTGPGDTIQITSGEQTLTAPFYRLKDIIENIGTIIPPACPDCEGTGEVLIEERDLAICGTCNGTRISRTSPGVQSVTCNHDVTP